MVRAFVILSALLLAAPASAATYSAKTLHPAADSRIIARDIVWNCIAGACRGSTQESRPLVLCQSLAKKAGPLASFAVNGRPIAETELNRCNAAAPAGSAAAIANAN